MCRSATRRASPAMEKDAYGRVCAPVSSGSPCFALQIPSAVPGVPWTRSDWLSQYRESRSISLRWTFNPADALHWLSIENRHLTTAAHFSYPFALSFFPALSRSASHSIRARTCRSVLSVAENHFHPFPAHCRPGHARPRQLHRFGNILMRAW